MLPSCQRSSDCESLFRSAEVFHPLRLDLQSGNTISFDSITCLSCIHALDKQYLLEDGNNLSHFNID